MAIFDYTKGFGLAAPFVIHVPGPPVQNGTNNGTNNGTGTNSVPESQSVQNGTSVYEMRYANGNGAPSNFGSDPVGLGSMSVDLRKTARLKRTGLILDRDLSRKVLAFADAGGFENTNEAIAALLHMALSADPVRTALGLARVRTIIQAKRDALTALNQHFEEQIRMNQIMMGEDATRANELAIVQRGEVSGSPGGSGVADPITGVIEEPPKF
mgnify:CR=1 FL=1